MLRGGYYTAGNNGNEEANPPRRSGEADPIRAFEGIVHAAGQAAALAGDGDRGGGNGGQVQLERHQRRRAKLTHAAVCVVCVVLEAGLRRRGLAHSRFVIVLMMAEMLCRYALFMLAVRSNAGPYQLDRQQHEQKNGEPAAHEYFFAATAPTRVTAACNEIETDNTVSFRRYGCSRVQ